VVRNYDCSRFRSDSLQIVRRGLACPSIGNNVESNLLSLAEGTHASAFDRADVHEDILAAVIWLDKAEAFLIVEELHGSLRHITLLSDTGNEAAQLRSRLVRDLEKDRQSDAGCAARPSRSAEARQVYMGPLSWITRITRQES